MNSPAPAVVPTLGPRDIAMYFNTQTGETTIRFGSMKVTDAAHAIRSLAMMYDKHNKNPENTAYKYSEEMVDGFWEFAAALFKETETLSNGK